MFCGYLNHLEKTFKEQGGVKERMHAVRTGYRQEQDARMKALETENATLKAENTALKQRIAELKKKLVELG
jgi:cell division protein FtsB